MSELNYNNTLFSKGILLRTTNAIREAIYESGDKDLIEQIELLGRMRQQISQLQQNDDADKEYLKILEAQADTLDKTLVQASVAYRDLQADTAIRWQDVQNSLQENEAAVEFVSFKIYDKGWTGKTQYAALILRPGMDAPVWVNLCEEEELQYFFNEARSVGIDHGDQTWSLYRVDGLDLYKAIWEPLEQELNGIETIYYSPSGLLHKIAFNALPVDEDYNLLVDKYNLNLVSSTREIKRLSGNRAETAQIRSAVLYGGLDYDTDEETMQTAARRYTGVVSTVSTPHPAVIQKGTYKPLKNSLEEMKKIQVYLNKRNIPNELLTGSAGNEESFKQLDGKKTELLHLSTHGFFVDDIERRNDEREQMQPGGGARKPAENPLLRSGIVLSGCNHVLANEPVEGVENGVLTADKIAGVNLLGAKLVILSACETGLGDVNNSEGVFGLQRAFKLAGVETLIMSLWEVPDAATSLLMNTFYEEWLSGKSKREAFKEAQRQIRTNDATSAPYFWAAFVLMD